MNNEFAQEVRSINIVDELKQSYLDYAMSVIVGRALPDVRDGLKPVHRRVLFAMQELGNDWNKPHKKSARVVGDVIGKYHPHSDVAAYDTIVRMAQDFSMRYVLVDGQGNFGSVDGDPPAAMRYTEVRMSKLAHQLMMDLDKETVDFSPNYDGNELIPDVLPTRIPHLLVNGASGIAVGMATNIPTHNLGEVLNASLALLDEPDLTIDDLMQYIPGPDFPTRGVIYGRAGILDAYRTGRGRVVIRARTLIETDEKTGKDSIIAYELPYQVNKAKLIEKIAELVKDKKIDGISALRDESDKDGMRVVIELKRGEHAEVILNHLYAQTQLQVAFNCNMVALIRGLPHTFNLKELLVAFLDHRREVVTRRSVFERRKAQARAHLLEGLTVALANLDPLIALIKSSANPAEARVRLTETLWNGDRVWTLLERAGQQKTPGFVGGGEQYRLSAEQAQAILDLRLHRLTGLEQDKITQEYVELMAEILRLTTILEDPEALKGVIRTELQSLLQAFGDSRRTEIVADTKDSEIEDFIIPEDVVVTLSHSGYIKYQSLEVYQAQKRGGKGKSATAVKDEDFITHLLIANTHDTLLCFSNRGRLYWLKVHQLPSQGRNARGRPIVNLLPLIENERITAMLPLQRHMQPVDESKAVFMATRLGTVKKTGLQNLIRPRSTGLNIIGLEEDDELVGVALTDGTSEMMLISDEGKAVRFSEQDVRMMGRGAFGVRGIRLKPGSVVIALTVVEEGADLLTATQHGFGKRTPMSEHAPHHRGGQGVIAIRVDERNGKVVGALPVRAGDDVVLISDRGRLVRTRVDEISNVGRSARGVTLIRLDDGENLVEVARIIDLETEE